MDQKGFGPTYWILFLTGAMNLNGFSEIILSGVGACGMDLNAIGCVTTWLLEGPRNGDQSNPYIVLLMLVLELLVRWVMAILSVATATTTSPHRRRKKDEGDV